MATQGPSTYVVNYADMRAIRFPVSGAGSNIPVGTLLMPGVTGGTNDGVLIPITATNNDDVVGVLTELHNFSLSGDATTATLVQWFPVAGFAGASYILGSAISPTSISYPSHPVDLVDTATIIKVDYSLSSTVAVASAAGATITITSFEANFDSGFSYVNAGTGIGQLNFVASSSSGSMVLTTSPTTAYDNTSKLTKILPLFYKTPVWKVNTTTVPTVLDSTAAAGTGKGTVLANFLSTNGLSVQLDPKIHNQTNNLNSVSSLAFYSYIALNDTALHPQD
jgi:hypothetical protein